MGEIFYAITGDGAPKQFDSRKPPDAIQPESTAAGATGLKQPNK